MSESAEAASSLSEETDNSPGLHLLSPGWCTLPHVSYATQPRYCRNYALWVIYAQRNRRNAPSVARFSLSSHPWELISVYCVHNSTVSKQLRYALMRESVPQPVSFNEAPYAVVEKEKNFDDKAQPLCYNQLKALYFCKRHHMTFFTGAHHFEEGRPLRIILQRTWKFSMLYLPINSRKIEMPYVDRMQKMQ